MPDGERTEDETRRHTPGMWVFDGSFVGTPAGQIICQMFNKREEDFENAEANARLIVMSPDLLDFVRDFVTEGCHHACTAGHCSGSGNLRMKRAKELLDRLGKE
ncbi:MAG TPA: hypothetical protein VF297_05365 [Pyrinomonadaceae bacterium]